MLFDIQRNQFLLLEKNLFNKIENERFCIYYSGIIFSSSIALNLESLLLKFIDSKEKKGSYDFDCFHGAFTICLFDKNSHDYVFFGDNSNMRSFYYSNEFISHDFLQISHNQKQIIFDNESIVQYLTLGTVYFGKTLLSGVESLNSEKYVVVSKGVINILNKNLNKLGEIDNSTSYNSIFQKFVATTKNLKLSSDLTGGYDSRLVSTFLVKYDANVNLFISGPQTAKDVIIAKKVALALNRPIDVYETSEINIKEKYIWELFNFHQTFYGFDSATRIFEFLKYRKHKNYDLRVTGDGGVMHKDWWWIQDFPFFNKKKTNIKKFYRQRIDYSKGYTKLLGISLQSIYAKQQESFIKNISNFQSETNSKTYDNLYFYVSGSKLSKYYNICSNIITTYAPLWERDLVGVSYNLPRRQRFFNNNMRKLITANSVKVSKIKTVYHMTSSSSIVNKMLDSIIYSIELLRKFFLVVSRRLFNKNIRSDVDIFSPYNNLKKTELFHHALMYAKSTNIITQDAKVEKLPDAFCDRLLSIYMLSLHVNGLNIQYKNSYNLNDSWIENE